MGYKPSKAANLKEVKPAKASKSVTKTPTGFAQDESPESVEQAWQAEGRKSTIKSDPSATLADFGFVSKEGPTWQTSVTDQSKYPINEGTIQTAATTLRQGRLGKQRG
jgi:hypothetical protein